MKNTMEKTMAKTLKTVMGNAGAQLALLFSLLRLSQASSVGHLSGVHAHTLSHKGNLSAVDVLRETQSRSFLHCCSLCHVGDGCRGVAYAQGECWLIKGVATEWVCEERCSTGDYQVAMLHTQEDAAGGSGAVGSDCAALLAEGASEDGVYSIHPPGAPAPFQTFCSMSSGGWSVIQRRVDDSVDFYRGWADYVAGFGDFSGNVWAGLDNIHAMTSCGSAELYVTMENWDGDSRWAHYNSFHVGDAASGYVLNVAGYSGSSGDCLGTQNLQKFTTFDNDQDLIHDNCAVLYKGAWWYSACHFSNPNGEYLHVNPTPAGHGVIWQFYMGFFYSLKTIEFKVRCT